MTTKPDLDALLATPLEPVPDNGFSRAVDAKMAVRVQGFAWFELGAAIAVLALVVLFAPVARIAAPFVTVALQLGLSLPFAVACAAIALSQATFRLLPD